MRIPKSISNNAYITYEPSTESKSLFGEIGRTLLSENFNWDENHCPTLAALCIQVLAKQFKDKPELPELICEDHEYLLELLDVTLPLEVIIPIIQDECYWQRRYHSKFGTILETGLKNWTWKSLYIERHVQDMVEQAQPEHNDEEEMGDILAICCPYIKKLRVTQLQAWKPPLHWDEEDIPEFYPNDHISFEPIFKKLPNIEEFDLIYGMNKLTEKFKWDMFKVSLLDCQRLGKALNILKQLRILKIHRSRLDDKHIQALMQGLVKNESIEELDLSHCQVGDHGALCIAKVLCVHPNLRVLNLCDNKIKCLGGEGIGFALLEEGCHLEKLNIKLNPLGEGGAMGIMRALVRGTHITELSMAACEYDDDAPIRTGQMLILNTSLKKLDVSNNWFDDEGGQALIDGLVINKTLEWLDIRETDVTESQKRQIAKYLRRNRTGSEEIEESISENLEDKIQSIVEEKSSEHVVTSTSASGSVSESRVE